MPLINHAIPNLINGVSQQPETLRLSSQAEAQENGMSSVVEGLKKRPPTELIKKVKSSQIGDAFIHTINRDTSERYILIITDDALEVYDINGTQKTVVDAVGGFGTYIDESTPSSAFECVTIADYTFIINKNKVSAKSSSVSASRPFEAIYTVKQGVTATKYEIKINGTAYSYTTTDTASTYDATNICTQLVSAIGSLSGFTITNLGTHIYFSHASDFTIQAIDGYGSQGSQVLKGKAQKFTDLPEMAVNGMVMEITNDAGNNFDNYFVKFESDSTSDSGVWVETVKPALKNDFDTSTMPHLLVRTADGNFRYTPADGSTYTISGTDYTVPKWSGRVAGDETSAADPSFIGQKIQDIFFHRNRLGFIAGENIFMSRSGDFFEMYPSSVTTVLDTDPIDVAVSHTKVSTLRSAIPFQEELLLFSDQSQFVLGGANALTPKNVNINLTTEYESSLNCKPVSQGRNVYFTFNKGEFSGVREYFVNADTDTNEANDITAHVPKYLPKNIYKMAIASNQDILACLSSSTGEQTTLYIYQWYVGNNERLQSAWHKWTFGNTTDNKILNIDFIDTKLYVLMQTSNGVEIHTIETAPAHKDTDATYLTHLDRKVNESTTGLSKSYNSGTGQTTITLPYTIDNTMQMVTRNVSGDATIAGQIVSTVSQTDGGNTIVVSGDYSAKKFFIGEKYTFTYQFSQQYLRTQSNTTGTRSAIREGRLQIKSWNVSYNDTGFFTTSVTPVGRSESTSTFTGTIIDSGTVNGVNLEDGDFTFAVQSRNDKLVVKLMNDTHLPSNFVNAEWLAHYTQTGSNS